MKNKFFAVKIALLVILMFSFFGCSSNERGNQFQIVFYASQVSENAVTGYGSFLLEQIPELTIEGRAPLFTPMVMGDALQQIDPMMAMGTTMRLTGLMATGEVDMIIGNMENASNMAQGESFIPLTEIFSESELRNLDDRLISFDITSVNESNARVPTGERTPALGISITGNDHIRAIFGSQEIGVFIITNTKNLELAKSVMMTFF